MMSDDDAVDVLGRAVLGLKEAQLALRAERDAAVARAERAEDGLTMWCRRAEDARDSAARWEKKFREAEAALARRTKERDRARDWVESEPHSIGCRLGTYPGDECSCGLYDALADEPEETP